MDIAIKRCLRPGRCRLHSFGEHLVDVPVGDGFAFFGFDGLDEQREDFHDAIDPRPRMHIQQLRPESITEAGVPVFRQTIRRVLGDERNRATPHIGAGQRAGGTAHDLFALGVTRSTKWRLALDKLSMENASDTRDAIGPGTHAKYLSHYACRCGTA
ncbi:MAG: hypothetical protein ACREO7_13475, partial [Pseudoxanthomonas sp.]